MTKQAATTMADVAARRKARAMNPLQTDYKSTGRVLQEPRRNSRAGTTVYCWKGFRKAKSISALDVARGGLSAVEGSTRVLLDRDAVVHLIDAQNLGFAAVATQFVILAHNERLDRLRRTDLGAEAAKAAARQIEVEVIEDFDFLPRLAMAAERNQVVGARLRALVADDARLCAGGRFRLKAQHAAKPRRGRTPFSGILKRKRRLRRVLQGHPQAFEQVDEENRLEEFDDGFHGWITRVRR